MSKLGDAMINVGKVNIENIVFVWKLRCTEYPSVCS